MVLQWQLIIEVELIMNKILIMLLLLLSTRAFAEWTPVGDNDSDDDRSTYVDFGTLKKLNNKVNVWYLFDFDRIQMYVNNRYSSSVTHVEYDCDEDTARKLDFLIYSDNMATGDVLHSQSNIKEELRSVMPASFDEILLKIACEKK